MSSPSAYVVDVENRRREEAARVAAVAEVQRVLSELEGLRQQAQELRRSQEADERVEAPKVADVALTASRAELERWIVDAQSAADALRAGIGRARARRADRTMLESLRGDASGKAVSVADVLATLPSPVARTSDGASQPSKNDWRMTTAGEAARLCRRLGDAVFEDDRAAVTALSRKVAASTRVGQAEQALDELRYAVQQSLARGVRRTRDQAQATQLRQQLFGLAHPQLAAVTDALQLVIDGRQPMAPGLRLQVQQVTEAAIADSDRQYTADVVAAAFTDLGYDVDVGFATELVQSGAAEFHARKGDEYGVRIHLGTDQRLRTHLVRYTVKEDSAEGDRRETAAAEAFCQDQLKFAAWAQERGVFLAATERHLPGTVPIMVVPRDVEAPAAVDHAASELKERGQ
jgi:hypothetical protein